MCAYLANKADSEEEEEEEEGTLWHQHSKVFQGLMLKYPWLVDPKGSNVKDVSDYRCVSERLQKSSTCRHATYLQTSQNSLQTEPACAGGEVGRAVCRPSQDPLQVDLR